jgi:hypothetical protein
MMSYVPPFELIKKNISVNTVKGKLHFNIEYSNFLHILKMMLIAVNVDEVWYLKTYPDVAESVKAGEFKCAKHHFIDSGYFEGRLPCEFQVDEGWYLSTYQDVAEQIKSGKVQSATGHFRAHGYSEGRLPKEF